MNVTLMKALVALAPTSILFLASVILFLHEKTLSCLLQVIGAGGLVIVAVAHIAEALHWFPWMNWGLENSPGHYLDLVCAAAGIILFPAGYLLYVLEKRHVHGSNS